jgi:hypothetical protein
MEALGAGGRIIQVSLGGELSWDVVSTVVNTVFLEIGKVV